MNTFNSPTRKQLVSRRIDQHTRHEIVRPETKNLQVSGSAPIIRIASHPEQASARGKVDGLRLLGGNYHPQPPQGGRSCRVCWSQSAAGAQPRKIDEKHNHMPPPPLGRLFACLNKGKFLPLNPINQGLRPRYPLVLRDNKGKFLPLNPINQGLRPRYPLVLRDNKGKFLPLNPINQGLRPRYPRSKVGAPPPPPR